jgi:hypothetical protein
VATVSGTQAVRRQSSRPKKAVSLRTPGRRLKRSGERLGQGSRHRTSPRRYRLFPQSGLKFSRWQTSGSAKVSDAESAETEATLSSYGGHVSAVFTGLLQNFAKPLDVDPHYKGFSADATANLSIHIIGRGQTDPVAGPYTGVPCSFTIKAKPADGSVFESWETSGRVHVASSDAEETLVYVFGNANLKAVFRPEYAHLRVKAGPGGAIAAPLKANSKVKTAQATPLKAKADEGYKFLKWTLSGHAQIANSSAAETDISLRNNAIAMAVFVRDYAKDGPQASASTSEADGGAGTLVTLSSGGAISANPPQGFHFPQLARRRLRQDRGRAGRRAPSWPSPATAPQASRRSSCRTWPCSRSASPATAPPAPTPPRLRSS